MSGPQVAYSYSIPVYGGIATAAYQLMVMDSTGFFLPATAANRAAYGRCRAMSTTAYFGAQPGMVSAQHVGPVDSGLTVGLGAADRWLRASATGGFEVFTPTASGTSDVVGKAAADGSVTLELGLWTEAMAFNAMLGLPALPTTTGAYNLVVAAGPAYSWALASGGGFDPATLSWTGFWKDYGAAPWSGSASVGPSSGRQLAAGVAPALGVAFGTHTSADVNGSTQFLTSPTLNYDSFLTRTAYYLECIFSLDTVGVAGTQPYQDATLIADNGGNIYLGVSSSGIQFGHYDDVGFKSTRTASYIACATGQKHIAQAWYDGTSLNLRLDGGTAVTLAAGSLTTAYNAIKPRVGANQDLSKYVDGQIARVGMIASVPSSTVRDQLRTDAQTNYGTL